MLDAYGADDARLSVAAFTGLMLLLHSGRRRGLSAKAAAKLDAFRETENWRRDLRTAYMELIKTIDTDRISRKIRDEVVPEMLKLRPEIDKKLNTSIEKLDPAEMDENPEWHDMLEKSGLADKLKEMSEIQEEGGDVMMGTFAHLKSFPFFNEPANWFLPFHADYSEFTGDSSALMQPVAELMAAAPFLCDSDKYSFMFSLAHVPAAQRDAMMSQFKAQGDQLAELQAASLNVVGTERKNLFNKQVQNISGSIAFSAVRGSSRIRLPTVSTLWMSMLCATIYLPWGCCRWLLSSISRTGIIHRLSPCSVSLQRIRNLMPNYIRKWGMPCRKQAT